MEINELRECTIFEFYTPRRGGFIPNIFTQRRRGAEHAEEGALFASGAQSSLTPYIRKIPIDGLDPRTKTLRPPRSLRLCVIIAPEILPRPHVLNHQKITENRLTMRLKIRIVPL